MAVALGVAEFVADGTAEGVTDGGVLGVGLGLPPPPGFGLPLGTGGAGLLVGVVVGSCGPRVGAVVGLTSGGGAFGMNRDSSGLRWPPPQALRAAAVRTTINFCFI